MEFPAVVALVLGLIGLNLLRRHLNEAKQLQLRKILHDERMKAMENGLSLPEADDAQLAGLLGPVGTPQGRGALFAGVLWVRLVALCLGAASVLGGAGTAIAMYLVPDQEVQPMWPLGLIPIFIGVGLLIFYGASKGMAGLAARDVEAPE